MAMFANAHRNLKTYPQPFKAEDFVLGRERPAFNPAAFRAGFANLVKKRH